VGVLQLEVVSVYGAKEDGPSMVVGHFDLVCKRWAFVHFEDNATSPGANATVGKTRSEPDYGERTQAIRHSRQRRGITKSFRHLPAG
jgi:hypothetical protein